MGQLQHLISSCLSIVPRHLLDVSELLDHVFFGGHIKIARAMSFKNMSVSAEHTIMKSNAKESTFKTSDKLGEIRISSEERD